jgi:hypothetical protein
MAIDLITARPRFIDHTQGGATRLQPADDLVESGDVAANPPIVANLSVTAVFRNRYVDRILRNLAKTT